MMIAITPSLNASSRPLLIFQRRPLITVEFLTGARTSCPPACAARSAFIRRNHSNNLFALCAQADRMSALRHGPALQFFSHRRQSNCDAIANLEFNAILSLITTGPVEFDSRQGRHQLEGLKAASAGFAFARRQNRP